MLKKLSLLCLIALAACTTKSEEEISYLLVMKSKHGEIKQAANGSFELILDHGDIERVLVFSDRPYRVVKEIRGDELKREWKEGANSFAQDPPNAAVIIDQYLQTAVLLNMRIEGSKTIFTIKSDSDQSLQERAGQTEIFLDGIQGGESCYQDREGEKGCPIPDIFS